MSRTKFWLLLGIGAVILGGILALTGVLAASSLRSGQGTPLFIQHNGTGSW